MSQPRPRLERNVVSMPPSRPIPPAPQMPPRRRLTESGSDSSARRAGSALGPGLEGGWLLVRGVAQAAPGALSTTSLDSLNIPAPRDEDFGDELRCEHAM